MSSIEERLIAAADLTPLIPHSLPRNAPRQAGNGIFDSIKFETVPKTLCLLHVSEISYHRPNGTLQLCAAGLKYNISIFISQHFLNTSAGGFST